VIRCRAFVDTIRAPGPVGLGMYRVEVMGEPPHDYVRIYDIEARDENKAAREGLDRFQGEFSAPDQ